MTCRVEGLRMGYRRRKRPVDHSVTCRVEGLRMGYRGRKRPAERAGQPQEVGSTNGASFSDV